MASTCDACAYHSSEVDPDFLSVILSFKAGLIIVHHHAGETRWRIFKKWKTDYALRAKHQGPKPSCN